MHRIIYVVQCPIYFIKVMSAFGMEIKLSEETNHKALTGLYVAKNHEGDNFM